MAGGSAFLQRLGLERHGLTWLRPEIDCVHPLDGGEAGVLHRSVEATAAGLGRDGSRWRLAFAGPAARFDMLAEDIMGPLLRLPRHPLALARFGLPTLLPGSAIARLFTTERGRALFGGVATHAFRPLHHSLSSAIALGIIAAGHRHGLPVAADGSRSVSAALAAVLAEHGGKIETGIEVRHAHDLPPADITMFPTSLRGPSPASSATGCRLVSPARTGASDTPREPSRSTSRSTAASRGRTRTPTEPARSISAARTPR
ncbi:hypothetical protein [Streptomyces sp. NPDC002403]